MADKPNTFELEGKTYRVNKPTAKDQREAQKTYQRAYAQAVDAGAKLRMQIDDILRSRGKWNDDKEAELKDIQHKLREGAFRLHEGGFDIDEAYKLALDMREWRGKYLDIQVERGSLDSNTAEGMADNTKHNHLTALCLVDDKTDKRIYDSLDAFEDDADSAVAIFGAQTLATMLHNWDADMHGKLPENQFLTDYGFVDSELRLINKDGHLIDDEGRLIDENNRFVDKDGNFVDRDGRRIDEEGNFIVERKPFTKAGKTVEPVKKEEEEEKPKRRGRPPKAKKEDE